MFGINACDVDTITVMGNAVNDCICQRTVITAELIIPFLKFILGARKSSKISCVSGGAVRRYSLCSESVGSIEAIHTKSGQQDWHT